MQNTIDTQSGAADATAGKSKFRQGVGKIFYYGLAIDSINRSLNRAKSGFTRTGSGILAMATSITIKNKHEIAKSVEDIETTFVSSAHNIVASLIFTFIFIFIAIFKKQDLFATTLNLLVGLTFFIVMICHAIVYLKAKESLRSLTNLSNQNLTRVIQHETK